MTFKRVYDSGGIWSHFPHTRLEAELAKQFAISLCPQRKNIKDAAAIGARKSDSYIYLFLFDYFTNFNTNNS
ncbi:hypothetical protein [Flavobacterium sp. LB2P44]|uniref:hypothetical protein n=1 Tax=Flavobacterium sp. LB2P44 TaxID=3401713 RepID=UPI003AAC4C1B